jgi:hypothetical protein
MVLLGLAKNQSEGICFPLCKFRLYLSCLRKEFTMPEFEFTITANITTSAKVRVEADTIEQAQEIALHSNFYNDPEKAKFEVDEGNTLDDVYLPDREDYEIVSASPKI